MKVILLEDIQGKGKAGDIADLSDGFVRNFLLPKKLAILATKQNLKLIDEIKERERKKREEEKRRKIALKTTLEDLTVTIKKKTGEEDRIFGQVTKEDIRDSLLSLNINIDKRAINLPETGLKSLGEYTVEIKLDHDIKAKLKIVVEKEE